MSTRMWSAVGLLALLAALSWMLASSYAERQGRKEEKQSSAKSAQGKHAHGKHQEGEQPMVQVQVFNGQGELVGPLPTAKLVLSDAEWKKRLTDEQYKIARDKGTERAFCGTLLDNKKEGVYTCVCCGLPLFSSDSKFNSGTGWPSFFQPVAPENVVEYVDTSHGMVRSEILCARCDGHLGHVFNDGPKPTGMRYCLNSASLNFTPSDELAKLADPLAEKAGNPADILKKAAGQKTETTVLAGGCFWCTEAAFEQLDGVVDVESGYAGGPKKTADYHQVSTGRTGHAEAIRITYDPSRISLDRLLDVFFDAHDPTQLNRQGNDVGSQYRSAIFYSSDEEKKAAEEKIAQLTKAKAFPKPIVTTLEPLQDFYLAEDYHQNYARNNPDQPYVQAHSLPKACKIRDKYTDLIKSKE